MVPDEVPEELWNLIITLEQELIARPHPIAKVYRKKGGKYAYSGHVINVAQDNATFATSLPWNTNSEDAPIMVIQLPEKGEWEGRNSIASVSRVQRALLY